MSCSSEKYKTLDNSSHIIQKTEEGNNALLLADNGFTQDWNPQQFTADEIHNTLNKH